MPAVVTVQYIEVSLPEFARAVTVSDDELLKFYQSNAGVQKKSFDQVKSSLRMRVAEQKSLQSFSDAVDKLTNLTYTNPQSLASAARALHLSIQTSPPLTQQTLMEGLFANEALKSAAFSSEVLAGNNSSPINLDDKHAVVVHLLNQTPQMVKPLAEVRDEIINILKLQKAESVATDNAQTLVANILSGASLVDLVKAKGFQVVRQDNLARFNSGKDAFIFNEAFQLPRPGKQNSAGMFRLPSSDIAVIQILQVKSVGQSSLQKIEQNVASEKIENAYAQLAYELYVNGVLNDSKIAISKSVDKNHGN
jgi:peptidyl-prolyl cis-trans isomerase D